MAWIKFPNQLTDLLKLRRALNEASRLRPNELKDDGIYGEALLGAGVIRSSRTVQELRALPASRQPQRTTARGLREMFILLGCMEDSEERAWLTRDGRAIASQSGSGITPTEVATWRKLISQLRFPHPRYPKISAGVRSVRPAHVVLGMLVPGPLPAQGLAIGFSAISESPQEIGRCRRLASRWSTQQAGRIAKELGITESELRNNAKVFPGILDQLGLINREGGVARVEPAGLSVLGATGAKPKPTVKGATKRPKPRAIRSSGTRPWTPPAQDPTDLSEKARLRLVRLEKANRDHQAAVSALAAWLRQRGFRTFEADYDILATKKGQWILAEVKSIAAASVRSQLMRAIGQLAYYAALSVQKPPAGTKIVRAVAFDRPFADPRPALVLKNEGISLLWIDGNEVNVGEGSTLDDLG